MQASSIMARLSRPPVGALTVAVLGAAIGLSACGQASSNPVRPSASSVSPQRSSSSGPGTAPEVARAAAHSCPSPAAARRARSQVRGAKLRYLIESRGSTIRADLRYIAHDSILLNALSAGDLAAARAEVYSLQHSQIVKHVTRIRVLRGSRVLIDGWPASFDVGGSERALRNSRGRSLGQLQITIQDIIGFIKLEHRLNATEVVVRGARGQVRTLLPAAKSVSLPQSGCKRVGGREYVVSSFKETSFTGEPLTIWLLTAA
jgi:hypothetical protein